MVTTPCPPRSFDKVDGGDDLAFYAPPRLVTHIDEGAVAALTGFYRELLPDGGHILDLMSSWISHLPEDRSYAVVGHGINATELAANARLDRWFVQDLNVDPTLPLGDTTFDAALCCVGVQYLQRHSRSSPKSGASSRPAHPSPSATPIAASRPRPWRSGARSTCRDKRR
ncbi:MAG: hypothetical protein ACRYG4_22680 [Janthinobacterium lividum]